MRRMTWLDALVYRFQHHWETSPQYRAAVTGVAGLVLVLLMCSCMGVVTLTANSALAGIGLAGAASADGGSANTGTNRLTGAQMIPTNTAPPYTPPPIPNVAIPSSQTPQPSPTDAPTPTPLPTATPCPGNCGGGGGGGGGTVSATASPTPWYGGQGAQVNVVTSSPNTGINIIINFSNGATILNNGQGQTDGSGQYTFSFTVPSSVTGGHADVVVMASSGAGTTIHQPCA